MNGSRQATLLSLTANSDSIYHKATVRQLFKSNDAFLIEMIVWVMLSSIRYVKTAIDSLAPSLRNRFEEALKY